MTQYFETTCPGCRREVRVRVAYLGRAIVCNRCDHRFVAGPAGEHDPTPREVPAGGATGARDASTAEATERRVAGLEDEARRLRSDLAARAEEAARGAERSRRTRERLTRAFDSLRALRDELRAARERAARDAEALLTVGDLLAERDRLRGEERDTRALLEAVVAERDGLELRCRGLARELELSGIEGAALRGDLESSEGRLRASRREIDEERREWEVERRDMIAEGGRLRDGLARAEGGLREAIGSLGSERADREVEREALRSEIEGLRGEVEASRLEGEDRRARLEDLLRQAVEEREDARRLHSARVDGLTGALSEAQRDREELSDRLDQAAERLREARDELDRREGSHECERRGHRLAMESLRAELDTERRALGDRIAADRARHEDELAVLRGEIEALRSEGQGLREEVHGLRVESDGRRGEVDRLRREAEELLSAREELARQLDMACRDRDASRARPSEAEAASRLAGRRDGDDPPTLDDGREARRSSLENDPSGSPAELRAGPRLRPPDDEGRTPTGPGLRTDGADEAMAFPDGEGVGEVSRRSGMAPLPRETAGPSPGDRNSGATSGSDRPPTRRELSDFKPRARDESWARWPLPEVGDLDAARRQIELLSGLLRMAEQANLRLSDRLARLRESGPGVPSDAAASGRAGTPDVGSRADTMRDEVAWHYGVARRAASLARRRRSGGP